METKITVASFKEAFEKYLSYIDDNLSLNTLASFAKLKETKKISYENERLYWCGNHHTSDSRVELVLVEQPCLFYVVKYHYSECSDNSHSRTETHIFVPNE